MIWIAAAWARDIDVKVHDMKGVVSGSVTVELSEPGGEPLKLTPLDDGKAPDAVAGDHLYTARLDGLSFDHGSVTVRASDQTWQGGFRFDEGSDPVLLVGLEERGFAAASTREVMFVAPGGAPGTPGVAPGTPGGTPGVVPGAPEGAPPPGSPPPGAMAQGPVARKAPTRTGAPEGLWMGWAVFAAAFGAVGAVVWARGRPRIPAIEGLEPRPTNATRGAYAPAEGRVDLFVGPGTGARLADGRWTPDEVALAARRLPGPGRVVVTDPTRVEAEGDGYAALVEALDGIADLLWVEGTDTSEGRR